MNKLLLILLITPFISLGQYSNYYNIKANINKNVNVSGYITQNVNVRNTVTTIDYGALANANAKREANKILQQKIAIEQAQYNDEKERSDAILNTNRAIEIAENPIKAHTYGYPYRFKGYNSSIKGMRFLKLKGFISFEETMQVPHNSLFENVGGGRWENISTDGITTELEFESSKYNYRNFPYLDFEQGQKYFARAQILTEFYLSHDKPKKRDYKKNKDGKPFYKKHKIYLYKKDLERYYQVCDSLDNYGYLYSPKTNSKLQHIEEKAMNYFDGDSTYCHKKESVKRLVYGHKGFRYTMIWEDDYEKCITDTYESSIGGMTFFVKVRYKADKWSNITFEDLEGRRFYLSKFVDKTIAKRSIKNQVYATEDSFKPKRRSYSNSEDYIIAYESWYKKFSL
tara:strand:+ start:117 stop:1313 length:1197 start_codon:yes stop_codon:yes gene_type:complete